jgi:CMP-N,N'-diacetyllegionaminic acid synthase
VSIQSAPNLALVVARGGSKSIPRKNLAPLAGRPLIAWTIEAALRCGAVSRVIVSTEDEEIAAVARAHGAETPFLRPRELAADDTPTIPVVMHALQCLQDEEGYSPDRVVLLQPTSPLRTAGDITAAIALAEARAAESVISVTPAWSHPHLAKRITTDGLLEDFAAQPQVERRQDLEPAYALNGAIYIAARSLLNERQTFYGARTYAYVMPPERSIDVDTAWDLHLCDLILRDLYGGG